MTDELLFSAEPVFSVDGGVRGELGRDILRLEVEETTAGLKTLTARVAGTPAHPDTPEVPELYLDGSVVDFGRKLEVSLGRSGAARTVFRGWVSALEAVWTQAREPQVVIFAEDRAMDLRMTRRMRTYENVTDADIARAIAAEHGLTPNVNADGPTYDVVQQWNQSDLAFLRDRALLIQAEVWVDDTTLYFQSRSSRTGTEITLAHGNHLLDVQLRADLAHQRTALKVSGYDARERDVIEEEADGSAVQAEVTGGLTGPQVLQRAFGARVSHRVRDVPLTDGEARDWARAEMLRRARGFVTAVGTTDGTPDMVVGSRLTLERVGGPFNGGPYYVTRVLHTYDRQSGFRTRFEAERATVNGGTA
ncbi:MAG TPA: contractile injection system protein, VgrG/Pvc8 family [Longimicrobium sp.]|jgi:phage protein D|uniref:phage late control D family protein n=1 Tax=Longimicrobium sp. TaxID=2029185 RepID=UPI002ED8CFD6